MNVLLILIPISLLFLLLAIACFFWAMRSHQFENLESAALDILSAESELGVTPNNTDAD